MMLGPETIVMSRFRCCAQSLLSEHCCVWPLQCKIIGDRPLRAADCIGTRRTQNCSERLPVGQKQTH